MAHEASTSGDRHGSDDALEHLTRRVTLLGTIIAAFVAANSGLTTCTNDSAARYAGFRQAVGAEEAVWKALYDDYLKVFEQGLTPDQKRAKLFAISALADRDVPEFGEYRLGLLDDARAKSLAKRRLRTMQQRLNQALDRIESSDPAVVEARKTASFAAAEVANVQGQASRDAEAVSTAIAPAAAPLSQGISYQTQILSRGDPKGWDLDIFWCAGGGTQTEIANFALATDRGHVLAAQAAQENGMIGKIRLGRVRLRVLPEARQGINLRTNLVYPRLGDGNQLRAEASERDAVSAVMSYLNQKKPGFSYLESQTRTPWYFSLFACTGPAQTTPAQLTSAS